MTLLMDCRKPKLAGDRNGDLAELVLAFEHAIDECNADKEALRKWSEGWD